jgi:type III secretion protein T
MTVIGSISSLNSSALGYLLAASFATCRLFGVLTVSPVFSRLGLTGMLRGGAALALALPLVPMIADAMAREAPLSIINIAVILLKETFVGAIIGLTFGVPFWAAEAAGDILDLQRGSTLGSLLDPSSVAETNITATLFAMTILAMFFVSGGFTVLVRVVYDSYTLWPVPQLLPMLDVTAARSLVRLLDAIMSTSLTLAVPVMLVLLLTDLVLALLARAAPQLHIFDLSLSTKNLVFSLVMVLYCGFLIEYLGGSLMVLLNEQRLLESILGIPKQ